jgi:alkanesulfonate monooxygenase SsuD/methylene tetrahydromethanopterin reductase-like flavin-dependent oxidoreductase (luciferase family)
MRYSYDDIAWMWSAAAGAFSSFWLSDHFTTRPAPLQRAPFDSWTALCGLATRVPGCQVGVLVSAVTLRPPVPEVLMRISDTAFRAIGPRLAIGVGAGWYRIEHEYCGLPFPPVGDRMDLLANQVMCLRNHFEGLHRGWGGAVPSIVVGGLGRRTLEIAARFGDAWNGVGDPELIGERIGRLRALCERFERNPNSLEMSASMRVVLAQNRSEARRLIADLVRIEGVSLEFLRRRVSIGTVDEIRARAKAYLDVGVRHLICQLMGDASVESLHCESPEQQVAALGAALRSLEES